MAKSVARHPKRIALPWLNGLIPDSDAARSAIASRYGVSPRNPFTILEHTGSDAPGAVRLLPPEDLSSSRGDRGSIESLTEDEVGDQLRLVIEEYRDGRADARLDQRFSLPGAQPKIALVRTEEGWARALGSAPTTHILKPVSPEGFRRADVVEYLSLTAARILGLRTSEFWLERIGGHRVFVSRRYDRASRSDGTVQRVHQEDLGQSLAVAPDKMYQRGDGGPGISAVGALIRSLGISTIERAELGWDFFASLAYNSVTYCTDAHIKNYSIMLEGPHVSMAPMYDVNSVAPYLDEGLRFGSGGQRPVAAMSIDGEYHFDSMTEVGFAREARRLGVDPDRAVDEVRRLRRGAVGAFESARDELIEADADTRDFARAAVDRIATIPTLDRSA
jgi:serine/threonine-protein kinase HipA